MNLESPFDQTAALLPFELRQLALALPRAERIVAEELRLRAGQPVSVTLPEGEAVLPGSPILSEESLRTVLEIATQASAHTALEHVRRGFVTVTGGHRLGLCGTAAVREGSIHNFRQLSSINIRIAKEVKGIGEEPLRWLRQEEALPSVLILAQPGAGKTTLLRDLIRGLSNGVAGPPLRVGVADERGELGALLSGIPQLDVGAHTDVMDGCSKAEGLMLLLRGMNPQVLAVDEITAPEDIEALEAAAGCGVTLLATAHGRTVQDLEQRPLYRRLLERRIFQAVLLIEREGGQRRYRLEKLPC